MTGAAQHLAAAAGLLAEGRLDAAIAELEGSPLWPSADRFAAADLRLRAWLAIDPQSQSIDAAYREVIAAADEGEVDGVRRRIGYRRSFAQYLVASGRPDEAESLALEALALGSLSSSDDFALLNVVAMHTCRPGAWALLSRNERWK